MRRMMIVMSAFALGCGSSGDKKATNGVSTTPEPPTKQKQVEVKPKAEPETVHVAMIDPSTSSIAGKSVRKRVEELMGKVARIIPRPEMPKVAPPVVIIPKKLPDTGLPVVKERPKQILDEKEFE